MKKTIALQLMIMMLCVFVPFAKAETVTILNCDKVNIRNDAGQSLGRLGCYTPVSVGETKGDSTYITASRAYLELYQEQYEYSEYIDFYSGDISGWVKTRCLSEVNEEMDHVIYKAEEYRWEYFVDGIYHEIKSTGVVKKQCYEFHKVPTINLLPLSAHTKLRDVMNKGSAYYHSSAASGEWREAYYDFIMQKQLLLMDIKAFDEDFYAFYEKMIKYYDSIEYCLYDINQDGVPELIMDTGDTWEAGTMHAFFTYKAGEGVVYMGKAGSRHGYFQIMDNDRYHGLLWAQAPRGALSVDFVYYNHDTQQIEEICIFDNYDDEMPHRTINQRTEDTDLFQACFDTYYHIFSDAKFVYPFKRNEMPDLDGWNAFLESYGY